MHNKKKVGVIILSDYFKDAQEILPFPNFPHEVVSEIIILATTDTAQTSYAHALCASWMHIAKNCHVRVICKKQITSALSEAILKIQSYYICFIRSPLSQLTESLVVDRLPPSSGEKLCHRNFGQFFNDIPLQPTWNSIPLFSNSLPTSNQTEEQIGLLYRLSIDKSDIIQLVTPLEKKNERIPRDASSELIEDDKWIVWQNQGGNGLMHTSLFRAEICRNAILKHSILNITHLYNLYFSLLFMMEASSFTQISTPAIIFPHCINHTPKKIEDILREEWRIYNMLISKAPNTTGSKIMKKELRNKMASATAALLRDKNNNIDEESFKFHESDHETSQAEKELTVALMIGNAVQAKYLTSTVCTLVNS